MRLGEAPRSGAVLCALLVGCSDPGETTDGTVDTVADCKGTYSARNGYGAPSDAPPCSAPRSPAPEPDCATPTPQSVAIECAAVGVSCDPAAFITREAAECVARLSGLEPGLAPWSTTLLFDEVTHRPVWSVKNRTHEGASDCSGGGRAVEIDALSGVAGEITSWDRLCVGSP